MRGRIQREYGSKIFALFIVIIMVTVVYPVLINNASNPSQLSVCLLYTSPSPRD